MGIYAEQGPDDIAKICIDSKADIVVVESEPYLKKVLLVQHKLPELKAIVQWKGEPSIADKRKLHRTHKVGGHVKEQMRICSSTSSPNHCPQGRHLNTKQK